MKCSIEPRDRIYVKGYGCLSFAKNIGKTLCSKYEQKLLASTKISATDVLNNISKKQARKGSST